MTQIRVRTQVGENREIRVRLPDDVPIGMVDVIIEYLTLPKSETELTREQVRRRLDETGVLMYFTLPQDAVELSEEEAERLAHLLTNPERSSLDYINQDREDRV